MSISRTCRSCGQPLPEHLSDGTCPSCGSVQAGYETPKASGTPAEREGDFVVRSVDDRTETHHPDLEIPSTIAMELPVRNRIVSRPLPTLPGYREISWLNSGGMGDVYLGIQNGTERRVAIKVMRSGSNYDQNRERFQNEIRALGRVNHAGVVRVFECGESPFGPYFSMEFIEGETLSKMIKRRGPLPSIEAVRIVQRAAEAVHCAHQVDVLHRDIKPSNIMLEPNGSVKVTDFGLAKHTDADDTDELTETGVVIGTPSYIPPEQAEGENSRIGPASDVYGLGGTLYHLLTGHPPHAAISQARSLRQARFDDVIPAKSRRPDLCPVLNAILEKSLARDPADRYDSAEQFAAELENWLNNWPTIALPRTRRQRWLHWAHRRRVALAYLAVALFASAAAAVAVRESDPKRRIERALARGEKVILIGETGPPDWPKWHDWTGLPGLLDRSQRGDGTCGLQSQRYTGLVLVEDPMTDHYLFRAEIRHLGGQRAGDPGEKVTNLSARIGLFWGHQKIIRNGLTAEFLFATEFNDLTRITAKNPNGDDQPQPLRIYRHTFIDLPNVGIQHRESGFTPSRNFVSKDETQGIWRALAVEVHPDGITVQWEPSAGEPRQRVGRIPRDDLNDEMASAERFLGSQSAADWRIPVWTPRQPLGILSTLSTLSIRNATIEPLTPPAP